MPNRVELPSQTFDALDPTQVKRPQRVAQIAQRPAALRDAVIGLVTNSLQDEMMLALGAEVARRTGARRVLRVAKHGISVPAEPEDWAKLTAEARVAITGYGG